MNIQELKEKTLILTQTEPGDDMMFKAWKEAGLNADIIFQPHSKAVRMIRRIWADGFLPGASFWYGNWKKMLSHYNTVIVHADMRTRTVPMYIHKIKPDMRIIYWYWNPVNKYTVPKLTRDDKIECWSFDENDCIKYNMRKNIQYYYEQDNGENTKTDYDIYFVGHDKGRKGMIKEIDNQITAQKLHGKFDLLRDTDQLIPYSEVQARIRRSRAILEVNQKGQVGCTLRALESLFFRKKLITTNVNIQNEDFYNPENIFIYGKDDIHNLRQFIEKPYDERSDIFRDRHTVDTWFLNFFSEDN